MNSFEKTKPENPLISSNKEDFKLERKISKKDFLKDINFYVTKVLEVHPEPFRIITKDQFVNQIAKIKEEIIASENEEFDIFECYFYMLEIAALIQDGHTRVVNPLSQFYDYLIRNRSFFPFDIIICQNHFFLRENWNDSGIPLGSEILSINGLKLEAMFKETIKFSSGTFDEYKKVYWCELFTGILEFYYKISAPWTIEYRDKLGIKTITIDVIEWTEELKNKIYEKRYLYSHYTVRVKNEEVPVLVLPSLNFSFESPFKTDLDYFFAKYKENNYLIIDMRRNLGGNGILGHYILNHLIKGDTTLETHTCFDFKASKLLKEYISFRINSYLYNEKMPVDQRNIQTYKQLTNDSSNARFNISVLEAKENDFVSKELMSLEPIESKAKFKGKVFYLISAETFSAGVVTAAAFKHNKLGVVLGRETGGRIGFFSDPLVLSLPNSNLAVTLPVAIMDLVGEKLERGVIPDNKVEYTQADYLNQLDKDLVKVKKLIRNDL
ncbi:MAG: hypothetical protein GNW80_02480 [Asgard group archaeon]|nr:hypothetical protein [Asgard group archaeon]